MAFCQNCGNELADGTKFCTNCGTPVGNTESESTRKQTFVGEIRKCPSCGAEVPSMTAICPECGHEFANVKVDNSIKEFAQKLQEIESAEISHESKIQSKLADQDTGPFGLRMSALDRKDMQEKGKTFFLKYLCIFFGVLIIFGAFAVPNIFGTIGVLILGIGLILLTFMFPIKLSTFDKQKEGLIKSFVIPNQKESIIEFLMFASSQIEKPTNKLGEVASMFTNHGKKNRYWNKVWKTKISQAISKANITLSGDKDAMEKIDAIKAEYKIQ